MRLLCFGCGAEVAASEPAPFACPRARPGDDIDHVLRREGFPTAAGLAGTNSNPFVRYRERLRSYRLARAGGVADATFVAWVERLDAAVARVWGHGLVVTPLWRCAGLGGEVWVKDETGQVGGSHKARHLMGILLHLEVMERLGRGLPRETPLAIASCGNAALAAAVLALAAERPLQVFLPPWAHSAVQARLLELGAQLLICPREDGVTGDPCYHRFRAAVAAGAVPFCCQGPDNGLTIEGGETLAYELVSALCAAGGGLDRLFVQVGGGALASACVQGLAEAVAAGVLPGLPRIHAVQSAGAAPLQRAYERVRAEVAAGAALEDALRGAARRRSRYMWPWEQEPHSIAEGILDDETYDWLQIVAGMLRSGGAPLVVEEATLRAANQVAQEATGIAASYTGTAGLAGLLQLRQAGVVGSAERVAVLFTGVRR